MENHLRFHSAVSALATAAIIFALVRLDRTPDLKKLSTGVVHSPQCDRFADVIGATLTRHGKEDDAAEDAVAAQLHDLARAGVSPDDTRVQAIYAAEEADEALRDQRQNADVEKIRADARAAGCIR